MPLTAISIQGYRSVRDLRLPVDPCSIFVGANGVGKTNLYNALALLHRCADGTITRAIAEEGGVDSVLWAGARRRGRPVRLVLGADFDELDPGSGGGLPHRYEIEVGLPQPCDPAFGNEPMVKRERLTLRHGRRDIVMMERVNAAVTLRNEDGARETQGNAVLPSETVLATFRDGARYPEIEAIRRELGGWRLYHDFRTDPASPVRQPCYAITTPSLSADGHDLAAVLATLCQIRRDTADLATAVDDAFPGALLDAGPEGARCVLHLQLPDLPRPLAAHELSDGTLRYVCLLGALMGYRLPPLIALNEPEASLHPSLLRPLARLIGSAARSTRVWIVTHSETLADALLEETGRAPLRVIKTAGATSIAGLTVSGAFRSEEEEEEETDS